jgi:hypothetical protein
VDWLLFNGFWLLVPVLVWNAVFASKLPQKIFSSDRGIPQLLLILEHILRIPVFILPLLMRMNFESDFFLPGLIVYLLGSTLYYGSWILLLHFPSSAWSKSFSGVISPFIFPLIIFGGVALICLSWFYMLCSVLMISVHVYHGWLGWKAFGSQIDES